MANVVQVMRSREATAKVLIVLSLALLLILGLPGIAAADGLANRPALSDACVSCHTNETAAWQASPHAKAQIGCETCHGPLVADHPAKKGSMKLEVESTGCRSCHSATYDQWKSSPHAGMGVQCIGCHLSHSQKARLTDATLCGSCHGQVLTEAAHGAHNAAKIGCVDCHASSPDGKSAPSHTFTVVADNCVTCHGKTIHQFVAQTSDKQKPDVERALSIKVQELEESNRSMMPLMAINLGLGLGVGGLGGVVFMLAVMYIRERRAQR